ncbi:MAG: dithiol-disulfide isomerase [Acidimicrobiales bacterium]|nr:MAG: dithiol-disulfide isomerase [Acidimicrobiales bacterium]
MTPDVAGSAAVEVWADVLCPFAHWSMRRLRELVSRIRGERWIEVRVRAWPLEWVNSSPWSATHVEDEVRALRVSCAPDDFREFDAANFPESSIILLGAIARANEVHPSLGEQVSYALRDAVFERGLPLGCMSELERVLASLGLPLPDRATAEALVRRDWDEGRRRGVDGSPHFFVGGRSWFCPMLRVRHDQGGYHVSADEEVGEEFRSLLLSLGTSAGVDGTPR